MEASSMQNQRLSDCLQKVIDEEHAKEGITPALLEMVDLEIEYSPVIPFPGGTLEDAVPVRPWGFPDPKVLPAKFSVHDYGVVDRETLTVMRLRFLLARDARSRTVLERCFPPTKD